MLASGLGPALRRVLSSNLLSSFGSSEINHRTRSLVHAFPEAALGVAIAADGVIYQTDVFAASHGVIGSPRRQARSTWGSRGVLVLIGIRLGIDGVNPIYYDTIKVCMFLVDCDYPSDSASTDTIYLSSIGRNCRRPTVFFILLCRLSG